MFLRGLKDWDGSFFYAGYYGLGQDRLYWPVLLATVSRAELDCSVLIGPAVVNYPAVD